MEISFKLLLAGMLIISAGQLSANQITPPQSNQIRFSQTRKVDSFAKINLSGPYNYFIAMGMGESLRIEGSKNALSGIVTNVKDGTLNIYEAKPNIAANTTEKVNIFITSREISDIQLSGSGNVNFKEGIIAATLRLKLSGSGSFTGKVNVATVDCKLNGSGNIKLNGITSDAKVKLDGSGNFIAGSLKAANALVEVNGSGKAQINTAKSLNAKVNGTGAVRYSGNPKNITKSKAGGGQIVRV